MYEPYIMYLLRKRRYFVNKQVGLFLREVFGVGFYRSRRLTLFLGVNKNYNYKVKSTFNERVFARMQNKSFKFRFSLGYYLKKRRIAVSKFLQRYKLRRGLRQFYGLPSRGQRSHTNASSCKRARFKHLRVSKPMKSKSNKNMNKNMLTNKSIVRKKDNKTNTKNRKKRK
jgi:ribosomal protein S13